jgi:hypothetical protein
MSPAVAYRGGGLGGSNPPRNTKLQLSPEPLTRGPLPPDPRSFCLQLNLLTPPPNKIPGYAIGARSTKCMSAGHSRVSDS